VKPVNKFGAMKVCLPEVHVLIPFEMIVPMLVLQLEPGSTAARHRWHTKLAAASEQRNSAPGLTFRYPDGSPVRPGTRIGGISGITGASAKSGELACWLRELGYQVEHTPSLGEPSPGKLGSESDACPDVAALPSEIVELEEAWRDVLAQTDDSPRALQDWLRRDSWIRDEALSLLAGLIPERSPEFDGHGLFRLTIVGEGPKKTEVVVYARDLASVAVEPRAFETAIRVAAWQRDGTLRSPREVPPHDKLLEATRRLQELEDLWDSGAHPPRPTAAYVVRWAQRKGVEVPWLPWVRKWAADGVEVARMLLSELDAPEQGIPARAVEDKCERKDLPGRVQGTTRLEQQIQAIIDELYLRGVNPLKVPDGEKANLQRHLESTRGDLFRTGSFARAWKKGKGRIEMANVERWRQPRHRVDKK
jgi:hypothetical protein